MQVRRTRARRVDSVHVTVSVPITIRCECGVATPAALGDHVTCACGREYDTRDVIPPAAPMVPATTPAAISTIDSPGPDGTAESLAAPPPITTIVVALCSTAYRKRPCS